LYMPSTWLTGALVDLGKLDNARITAEAALQVKEFSVAARLQILHSCVYRSLKGNLLVTVLAE
jgi:hypothetical protein